MRSFFLPKIIKNMSDFLTQLKFRNELLYNFGLICLIFSVVCYLLTFFTEIKIINVNAWYKPFKFAFSTFLFVWAIGWYGFYLPNYNMTPYSITTTILLGFEIAYIAFQAGKGQMSHFNTSTWYYSMLFSLMGIAATIVTIYTAYIGFLFFTQKIDLPDYYLLAIRWSILIFVVFSFEGFVMGSKMTHTIGGKDGSPGIPLLQWSYKHGDLRIAHFIGMHALQVIPILSYYVIKNVKFTIVLTVLYLLLASWTLITALQGKPIIKSEKSTKSL
jgi:hypothetical protein